MEQQTLHQDAARITAARTITDLFPDPATRKAQYRQLSKRVHPDHHPVNPDDPASAAVNTLATDTFARLTALNTGTASTGPAAARTTDITTRTRTYRIGQTVTTDNLSNHYACTWERDGSTRTGTLRLPHDPRDNDLMTAHSAALKTLQATGDRRTAFLPDLIEAFRYRDTTTRTDRHATVTTTPDGLITLDRVLAAYPAGLDPRDAIWIWRRALLALSLAHENGLVHGAPVRHTIAVHPVDHAVLLTDWAHSVAIGTPLIAVPASTADLYPPEAANKTPATPATDLAVLARTFAGVLRPDIPAPLRAFIRGCTLPRPASRPQDPLRLLDELTSLVERLYGPRRYRVLRIPTVTTDAPGGTP